MWRLPHRLFHLRFGPDRPVFTSRCHGLLSRMRGGRAEGSDPQGAERPRTERQANAVWGGAQCRGGGASEHYRNARDITRRFLRAKAVTSVHTSRKTATWPIEISSPSCTHTWPTQRI